MGKDSGENWLPVSSALFCSLLLLRGIDASGGYVSRCGSGRRGESGDEAGSTMNGTEWINLKCLLSLIANVNVT